MLVHDWSQGHDRGGWRGWLGRVPSSVWRGLARPPLDPARGSRARRAGEPDCTTLQQNTHGTTVVDDGEVVYAWHPWAGRAGRLHEVITRASGVVLRCSL